MPEAKGKNLGAILSDLGGILADSVTPQGQISVSSLLDLGGKRTRARKIRDLQIEELQSSLQSRQLQNMLNFLTLQTRTQEAAQQRRAVGHGLGIIPPRLRPAVSALPPKMGAKVIGEAVKKGLQTREARVRKRLERREDKRAPKPLRFRSPAAAYEGITTAIAEVFPGKKRKDFAPGKAGIVAAARQETLARNFESAEVARAFARDRALQLDGRPRLGLPKLKRTLGLATSQVNGGDGGLLNFVGGSLESIGLAFPTKNRDQLVTDLRARTLDQALLFQAGVEGALKPGTREFNIEVTKALQEAGLENVSFDEETGNIELPESFSDEFVQQLNDATTIAPAPLQKERRRRNRR
tara:strand:+ start:621 stop:1682 length:1062 start_codon:yes stop_codon:yes gene_type:complete